MGLQEHKEKGREMVTTNQYCQGKSGALAGLSSEAECCLTPCVLNLVQIILLSMTESSIVLLHSCKASYIYGYLYVEES